jgi:hypothetical protein
MDISADGVMLAGRVKLQARANEVKCSECGALVFWVTLLRDSIKIQCITCYTIQHLRGPGIEKAIKKLKASEKKKLLPVGRIKRELKKLLSGGIKHTTETETQKTLDATEIIDSNRRDGDID